MEQGEGHRHEIVELEEILERNLCFQSQHFMACLHNEERKQRVLRKPSGVKQGPGHLTLRKLGIVSVATLSHRRGRSHWVSTGEVSSLVGMEMTSVTAF